MKLNIKYSSLLGQAVLETNQPSSKSWRAIADLVISLQDDASTHHYSIQLHWFTLLRAIPNIAGLRRRYGFQIAYNEAALAFLRRYRAEHEVLTNMPDSIPSEYSEDTVQERLIALGWGDRQLTREQRRDVVKMASLPNAANFSVPGAGKTTTALAVNLLVCSSDTILFVICPINAFSSWDESYRECFQSKGIEEEGYPFTRLRGTGAHISGILHNPPKRMITNYETIPRILDDIRVFIAKYHVHLILDESHRIKSGLQSITGATVLSLSHLPARKDILTGTPIPRSIADIRAQLDFLWPGHGVGKRVAESASPSEEIRHLHVRTTKQELGLPPVRRIHTPVKMSKIQATLYGLIRSEILRRWARVATRSAEAFARANRCVMRLLQASSNPILVARSISESDDSRFLQDETSLAVLSRVMVEEDSPKIRTACEIAREIVEDGAKILIWTSFVYNVERIAQLLEDLGVTYIHGGIPSGNINESNTREGRIAAMNDPTSSIRVLVANPAACGEGVSLHKQCHYAIYVDRTYNAGHFLQSVDRIHRLGLPPGTETTINVLESIAPAGLGSIDKSVRQRTALKLRIMENALEDKDLRELALDEEDVEAPIDTGLNIEDLADLITELKSAGSN